MEFDAVPDFFLIPTLIAVASLFAFIILLFTSYDRSKEKLVGALFFLGAAALIPGNILMYVVQGDSLQRDFEDHFNVRVEGGRENHIPVQYNETEVVRLFKDNEVQTCLVSTYDEKYSINCDDLGVPLG